MSETFKQIIAFLMSEDYDFRLFTECEKIHLYCASKSIENSDLFSVYDFEEIKFKLSNPEAFITSKVMEIHLHYPDYDTRYFGEQTSFEEIVACISEIIKKDSKIF